MQIKVILHHSRTGLLFYTSKSNRANPNTHRTQKKRQTHITGQAKAKKRHMVLDTMSEQPAWDKKGMKTAKAFPLQEGLHKVTQASRYSQARCCSPESFQAPFKTNAINWIEQTSSCLNITFSCLNKAAQFL